MIRIGIDILGDIASVGETPVEGTFLLMEDGSNVLTEDGGNVLTE